jgi:hypothetical protein
VDLKYQLILVKTTILNKLEKYLFYKKNKNKVKIKILISIKSKIKHQQNLKIEIK